MEEWIEWMKEELHSKSKCNWDETDWDAYYYILAVLAEESGS